MKPEVIYYLVLALQIVLVIYLQKKYHVLCNDSTSHPKPYSFSRWQLVWWTFIILATFISVIIATGKIPDFGQSTLILLGIGSITTVTASLIDLSDDDNANAAAAANAVVAVAAATTPPTGTDPAVPDAAPTTVVVVTPPVPLKARDIKRSNFLLDILSDKNGISIHRLQAFIFNLVFGLWFIYTSVQQIKLINTLTLQKVIDGVMPVVTNNNLILLGMSAGLYTALKSTENK
ncbi:MAG: hypothetical protein ABIN91_17445 [Mucilaginibacter sp.]|uniref:hypothetical protein n=1 Tax=Mucilaginibacter sp. TaxID=1882438 RepID=UPI003262FEE8